MTENSQQFLFEEAAKLYRGGNYLDCLSLLNQCLFLFPNSLVYNNRAIVYYRLGDYYLAERDLKQSVKLDHLNYISYFNLFSLNTLSRKYRAAFQNLCFCLSSILTVKCKGDRDVKLVERALYFSFNNKEAIVLKGLMLLKNQQYQQSIDMLKMALSFQPDEQCRQEMIKNIRTIQRLVRGCESGLDIKFVGGDKFQLKTGLSQPDSDCYQDTIKEMVRQFKELYEQLKENQRKQGIKSKELTTDSLIQEPSLYSSKEDEQSGRMTANNSLVGTESDFPFAENQRKSSYMIFLENKDSSNSIIPQEPSSLSESPATPQASEQSETESAQWVNFKVQYAQLTGIERNKQKQLFALLSYNKEQNEVFRTALVAEKNNKCVWSELSQPFKLSVHPSSLNLKIYSKNFDRFADELIGSGQVFVDRCGAVDLPLYSQGGDFRGKIVLGVSLRE